MLSTTPSSTVPYATAVCVDLVCPLGHVSTIVPCQPQFNSSSGAASDTYDSKSDAASQASAGVDRVAACDVSCTGFPCNMSECCGASTATSMHTTFSTSLSPAGLPHIEESDSGIAALIVLTLSFSCLICSVAAFALLYMRRRGKQLLLPRPSKDLGWRNGEAAGMSLEHQGGGADPFSEEVSTDCEFVVDLHCSSLIDPLGELILEKASSPIGRKRTGTESTASWYDMDASASTRSFIDEHQSPVPSDQLTPVSFDLSPTSSRVPSDQLIVAAIHHSFVPDRLEQLGQLDQMDQFHQFIVPEDEFANAVDLQSIHRRSCADFLDANSLSEPSGSHSHRRRVQTSMQIQEQCQPPDQIVGAILDSERIYSSSHFPVPCTLATDEGSTSSSGNLLSAHQHWEHCLPQRPLSDPLSIRIDL